MPNDCYNYITLTVKKDKELFDKIKANLENEEKPTLFSTLYPEPDYTKEDVVKAFGDGKELVEDRSQAWWDWRVTHWGTKWEVYDVDSWGSIEYEEDEEHGEYSVSFPFSTAWSPPIEWYDYVTENYPAISIDAYYEEFGCCFAGQYSTETGDLCVSWNTSEDMEKIIQERGHDLPDVVESLKNELEYFKKREAEDDRETV